MTKLVWIICGIVLLSLVLFALWQRFDGVTNKRIRDTVLDESSAMRETVDSRYRALDRKLDRIEGKLDRILELANRPMPDNLNPVR